MYILRSLVEKSLEWNLHIWVCDGDIKKAYDYTRHSRALDGLSRMFEVERNPTTYLTVLNQWAQAKERIIEVEKHHTLN